LNSGSKMPNTIAQGITNSKQKSNKQDK